MAARRGLAGWILIGLFGSSGFSTTVKPDDYPDFYTNARVVKETDNWLKTYPSLVSAEPIGKTVEGREIRAFRITHKPGSPAMVIVAGIHPREQPPTVCAMRFVNELLSSYGSDEETTRLLNSRELWLIPVLNVDGKEYDFAPGNGNGTTRGADWRKNRQPHPGGNIGVDLNRNFGIRWGGNREIDATWKTTTDNPKADIFEGSNPFSEPETRALDQFLRLKQPRVFVDFHCPFRSISVPHFLPSGERKRFGDLVKGILFRQKTPYDAASQKSEEPAVGSRSGDTGLTYTWAYYTRGIYSFNLEFGRPGGLRGPTERYLSGPIVGKEYTENIREPLRYLLDQSGSLPKPVIGKVASIWTSQNISANGSSPVPIQDGRDAEFVVLTSSSAEVVVQSEYRSAPFSTGFTVASQSTAIQGKTYHLHAYFWNRNRELREADVPLKIGGWRNSDLTNN